jgi:NAD(P)-dependent dehydrogenase (short-subunit alcohol dehydrogenase family)
MPRRGVSPLRRLAWGLRSSLNEPVVSGRRGRPNGQVAGSRVLVTGASSGIGRAAAARLAEQGARVVAVARRERELALLCDEIAGAGGVAAYYACDLAEPAEVDGLVRRVLDEHGGVDVLVNNAGRSMRRPVGEAVERVDDFSRALAVNYLGPVRLTMGLLPVMLERRSGHVVNVGTWTVPVGTSPRFAAYHSSKVALTGFGRSLDAEVANRGVHVSAVHFPLVHTALSAPTKAYGDLPGLSPAEAAEWIVTAIERRPVQIAPRYALLLASMGTRVSGKILLRWG